MIIAYLKPPRLFEYKPIAALSKNNGINPAITIVGEWKINNKMIIVNCPNAPNKKPIVPALGEPKPKVAATSIPGTEPGNHLSEIPVKDSVNSLTNVRTPNCKIAKKTANCNEVCKM